MTTTREALVLQLALPHYRQKLVTRCAETLPELTFFTGNQQFYPGVDVGVSGGNVFHTGDNCFFAGRRLAWQRLPLRRVIRASVVVVEINPRAIHTWLVAVLRFIARRKTIGWGHVYSRAGKASKTNSLRILQRKLCTSFLVYTESERVSLQSIHGTARPCFVASNGMYLNKEMSPVPLGGKNFISIGRLTESKKPILAVKAFANYVAAGGDGDLLIVGEGSEEHALRETIASLSLQSRIHLCGQVEGLQELRSLFASCRALVSPGYVGLNATQALGFGLPVIYALDEPHAPEVEALDILNSVTFIKDESESLAEALAQIASAQESWECARESISQRTRFKYSVESMAEGFASAVRD